MIFDEAHHLRNAETMSHTFARLAMDMADYKLLLSATPTNLRSEDLRNLLAFLDPDTFDNAFTFNLLADENRPLVAARDLALQPRTPFAGLLAVLRALPRGAQLKTIASSITCSASSRNRAWWTVMGSGRGSPRSWRRFRCSDRW